MIIIVHRFHGFSPRSRTFLLVDYILSDREIPSQAAVIVTNRNRIKTPQCGVHTLYRHTDDVRSVHRPPVDRRYKQDLLAGKFIS